MPSTLETQWSQVQERACAGDVAGALALADRLIAQVPDRAGFHAGRAELLDMLGRRRQARRAWRRALVIQPRRPRTLVRLASGRADAPDLLRRALVMDPDQIALWAALAAALNSRRDWRAARDLLARAPASDDPALATETLRARMRLCDWRDLPRLQGLVADHAREGGVTTPFVLLNLPLLTVDDLRDATAAYVARLRQPRPVAAMPRAPGARRVIGYLSADFHAHATAYLIADLLECHDRRRFEIRLYSWGPDDGSAMRARIRQAADAFVEIGDLDDQAAAALLAADGVDIAVDLKGWTEASRSEILAARPAPVQVQWLGYPGTLAAGWIDYVIADPVVCPPGHDGAYVEKIVRLPDTYQPNDRRRPIGPRPSRARVGLPPTGFVFACMCAAFKIQPDVFAVWMALLRAVPDSVLWLLSGGDSDDHLRAAAEAADIDPARLVFAPPRPLVFHLARFGLADLSLDTFPYGAHTTASDALWAGVPHLALMGDTFASRVSGSLVRAAGLPELVTGGLDAYHDTALALATQPQALAALRDRLAAGRATCPLFNTPRFTRHLEAAFNEMWILHQEGQPPTGFQVPPEDDIG